MSLDPHYLECARAALAIRIEAAKTHRERKELREWLAEIEATSMEEDVLSHCEDVSSPFDFDDDPLRERG